MAMRQDEDELLRGLTATQRVRARNLRDNVTIISEDGEDITYLFDTPTFKTTPAQRTSYVSRSAIAAHERANGGYIFAFFTAIKPMAEQFPTLTQSDMARVMFLSTYIAWESGELRYDNGRVIDKKALENLIDISRSRFSEFYKKIIDAGILTEVETGKLIVDKSLFYRGETSKIGYLLKDRTYTRLFRTTVRELYAAYNGRTIKNLGLIYALLPYVNFHHNIIASNPQERDARYVHPIELNDLSSALGYSNSQKLKKAMRKLIYDGRPVFAFVDMGMKSQRIIVNPRVLFAGSDKEALDSIGALFNEKGTIAEKI